MISELANTFAVLMRRIEEAEQLLNQHDRRINEMFREASVVDVDFEKGLATVRSYGDESESKWLPWLTQAGTVNDYVPLAKEQRVLILNPSGEAGKGIILPGGYSDMFGQPHNADGEAKRVVGASSDLMTGSVRRIEAATIELVGDVRIRGGVLTHEDKNVGHDHKHTGVEPGGGISDVPV